MTYSYSNSNTTHKEDPNIQFHTDISLDSTTINGVTYTQLSATLSYHPSACEKCGCVNEHHSVIKYGFKNCRLRLGDLDYTPTLLHLKKQRFLCKTCGETFTAASPLFDRHCHISNIVKRKISDYLTDEVAMTTIARHLHVSPHTVLRQLIKTANALHHSNTLPSVISIDEFASKKGHMSFICVNADTHQIMDILPTRQLESLVAYFQRYPYEQRCNVKYVVMDMYQPYMSLVKTCFPNASVVIDTFHVIQHLNRALNRLRVQTMNQLRYNRPRDYRKLKSLWKLLLTHREDLDFETFTTHRLFDGLITQKGMVDYMIQLNPNLLHAYDIINDIKYDMVTRNTEALREDLEESKKTVLKRYVRTAIKSITKNQDGIALALETGYSNGIIEGINNRIKNIKRSGYGYSNLEHLKARIFVINRLKLKPIKNKRSVYTDPLSHSHIQFVA